MPIKRKLEIFDPNKSDSADTDFEPVQPSSKKSRKTSKKSSRNLKKRTKRSKYRGSDVSDDDDDSEDSLVEESFSEPDDDEEEQLNPNTGRAMRKVAKKSVNYEEDSNSEIADIMDDVDPSDLESPSKKPPKQKRSRRLANDDDDDEDDEEAEDEAIARPKRSKIVKLKITTPARATRATSAARTTRTRGTVNPLAAGLQTRRSTRAHTEEGDEPISLSTSGKHILREGHSPEPVGRVRSSKGSKGLNPAVSLIHQEVNPRISNDQEAIDTTLATEVACTNDQDDAADKSDAAPEGDEDDEKRSDTLDRVGNDNVAQDEPTVADNEEEEEEDDDDDDDDEIPDNRRKAGLRTGLSTAPVDEPSESQTENTSRRLTRGSKPRQKSGAEPSSDFEPVDASEEEVSESDTSPKKKSIGKEYESESSAARDRRAKSKNRAQRRGSSGSEGDEEIDGDEIAEELQDLKASSRKRRPVRREESEILYERSGRARKQVDYKIKPMDQIYAADEDAEDVAPTQNRRARGRNGASQAWERNLYTTFGPFGGGGGPAPVIGGPWGTGAIGGVESDSSDDETMQKPAGVGGTVGMTPTSAIPPGLLPSLGQTNNADAIGGSSGTPANLGKVKSQKALADADPLGVDQNVDFSKVGGLEGHIDQLKEMVQMPLLYPELFLKFHVTPPRGVLFHGPPGTGKTLLARALAASVGSGGRKITFYMRKGADALSKWVGEAERQLRLLFEEARKTQPSIIFFDEIDGLAPVRSSKQEQIHASIVSTLLALMDGMDGRGQVIVIGATNRPDEVDPALRRPGRFDREFYFPLPDVEARKSILEIHTKDWGIDENFKDSLAHLTKGYGGADLRALCTEAALNAIQRTYPQIYSSNDKLKVDADKIKITAKDFMLSIKKMIPSSARSISSGAVPLPKAVEPLLRDQLTQIESILDGLIPVRKRTTALQEAMYEQYDDEDHGFGREAMQQEFEKSHVFRPRLLIQGEPGMGQVYLGGAILNHLEGLHVQSFDLPTIYSDSARSPEAILVQLFAEVKRHKPSVIYLPGVDTWYHTLSDAAITTFLGLLRAIPPTDPVLVLGITDTPPDKISPDLLRDLFGFSRKNVFTIRRPSRTARIAFFATIGDYVRKKPKDFPEPANRKKRKLEVLELAPPPEVKPPTKEEIKAQKKKDHQILNFLKVQIQPIMDQIQKKYRKFRTPVIAQSDIQYLLNERDPNYVRPDLATFRPYELDKDKDGVEGLREVGTGKFFYNLETTTIEERLSNGFYARPKDFLADIRTLAKDSKHIGDKDRTLKANELLANVEVDIAGLEQHPALSDCENLYLRQLQRARQREEKYQRKLAEENVFGSHVDSDLAANAENQSGPPMLGEPIPRTRLTNLITPKRPYAPSGLSNGQLADADPTSSHTQHSVPSHTDRDIRMGGTDVSLSHSMQPPLHPSITGLSNAGSTKPSTLASQRSIFQEISHDTSPRDLINDASTTTSEKKSSGKWSTHATNGIGTQTSSSPAERPVNDSDIPDTQGNSQHDTSSEEWNHFQAHALARANVGPTYQSQTPSTGSQLSPHPHPPHFSSGPHMPVSMSRPTGFANLLNDSFEVISSPNSSQNDFIIDHVFIDLTLSHFIDGTSGCSIEQLEQINRELMVGLWELRSDWNRTRVMGELAVIFNKTIKDIEQMQRVLDASQP